MVVQPPPLTDQILFNWKSEFANFLAMLIHPVYGLVQFGLPSAVILSPVDSRCLFFYHTVLFLCLPQFFIFFVGLPISTCEQFTLSSS